MKKPLSKSIKTLYGLGDLGFGLMTAVELYYFVFFLTNVAKFSLPMVALIGSITSIVDAVLSPFYGAIISGTKAMRWGRNRSWMLITPPIILVLYMFQYTKIGPEPVAAAIVCGGFILSHVIWNIAWVANVSLIPVMANSPEEFGLLSARRGAYTALSGVFFSYIAMPMANFFGKVTGSEVLGYTLLAGVMGLTMWIGYWVVFKITDGYEPKETPSQGTASAPAKSEKVPASVMLKNVFQNPPLMVLIVADFFRFMPLFIGAAAIAYYFTYVAQDMNLLALFLLITGLAGVAGSYLYGPVSKKLSTRTSVIGGSFISTVLMIVAKFIAMNVPAFFVVMSLNGIIGGLVGAAIVGMYSDVATYGEWKTGKNATPFIMGLMNLSLKTAIISRGAIIPVVLAAAGFVAGADPATATQELKDAVINVYVFIPGMFTLASAVILAVGYKITNEKLAGYRADIQARTSGKKVEIAADKGTTV